MNSDKKAPLKVNVGSHYKTLKCGSSYEVEVLRKRYHTENNRDEFYVHYCGADKRFDEWLPSDKFVEEIFSNYQPEENDRRKARKGKNSQEEISEEEAERSELTKIKNIDFLIMGKYCINTWYYSPYPDEYNELYRIYVCEFCFKYLRFYKYYKHHISECKYNRPNGINVYRSGTLAIYQVNSALCQLYCQNLCLMAKLFIDHKTICYDVIPFDFYILCEVRDTGSHFAGYFSKEKQSAEGNNLSCIMVLPPYQSKGYGKLLIDFSYTLTRIEKTTGTPEKPLSEMGLSSYRSYWIWAVLNLLRKIDRRTTVKEISTRTGICVTDVVDTLDRMKLIRNWKGKKTIYISIDMMNDYIEETGCSRPKLAIEPTCINWKIFNIQNS